MFRVSSTARGRGCASNGSSVENAKEKSICYKEEKAGGKRLFISLFATELI